MMIFLLQRRMDTYKLCIQKERCAPHLKQVIECVDSPLPKKAFDGILFSQGCKFHHAITMENPPPSRAVYSSAVEIYNLKKKL